METTGSVRQQGVIVSGEQQRKKGSWQGFDVDEDKVWICCDGGDTVGSGMKCVDLSTVAVGDEGV